LLLFFIVFIDETSKAINSLQSAAMLSLVNDLKLPVIFSEM